MFAQVAVAPLYSRNPQVKHKCLSIFKTPNYMLHICKITILNEKDKLTNEMKILYKTNLYSRTPLQNTEGLIYYGK